jgi:LacI family transcriptional regulator
MGPIIRTRRPAEGRRSGAPTISDVAEIAGVSPMTVSRVINGEPNVRDVTREKVNAAVAALSYAPNRAARSLAGAGQMRIGLLYSNPSSAYLSEFLVGSLEQASRSDVQLIVEKCEIGDHEVEVARHLARGGIDGIILPPPLCDSQAVLDVLFQAGVPTVVVATGRAPVEAAAVVIDDFAAAAAMTRHVIGLGHARIGFIIGNPNQTASTQRLEGYLSALKQAGMTRDDRLIVQGLFTYRSGLDAAEQLLEQADPPSAIFASNDDMAAATVAVAHRRGLDVPGDLTVCGFDDSALATTIWPELTTIHQPIAAMSRAAVELLVSTINGRRGGGDARTRHIVMDYTLVRRQSDAAPRRRPSARGRV